MGVTSEFETTREPFSSCYICYQLLPVTTSRYQSLPVLPVATSCYQLLPVPTSRYQSLPVATSRYQLLPVATSCYQSLPVFSFGCCYRSLPVASGGHKLTMSVLIAALSCYQLLLLLSFVCLLQVDTSCCFCLSFTTCWMSLHANRCFVFINLLLFQGGSTPLEPPLITNNYWLF